MARPRIRAAKFGDVPAIADMIGEMHARSRFDGVAAFNQARAKAVVMQAIQRHGRSTYAVVADNGEGLEGFILAAAQPLYQVLDAAEVTDLFWYARPGAQAATAGRLLRAFHKWAPEGAFIRQAVTDAITDPRLSGRILERHGMRPVGTLYEKVKETSE